MALVSCERIYTEYAGETVDTVAKETETDKENFFYPV